MQKKSMLPFYQVFDDIVHQLVFTEYLKEMVGLPTHSQSSHKTQIPRANKNKEETSKVAEIDDKTKIQIYLVLIMTL